MAAGNATEISLATELIDGAISFDRLKQITDNFSKERELGTGALGTVYKASLIPFCNPLYFSPSYFAKIF